MRARWQWNMLGLIILALWIAGCGTTDILPSPPPPGELNSHDQHTLIAEYDITLLLNLVYRELEIPPRHFQLGMLFPGSLPSGALPACGEDQAEVWREAYCTQQLLASTVGVYTGSGADRLFWTAIVNFLDHYGIAWETFNETELTTLSRRFDAIWFPGGYSSQYRTMIKQHHLIAEFVESGGAFIGICAGAYYATSTMRWHGGITDYPLNLLDGDGIGPIPEVGWGNATMLQLADHRVNRILSEPLLDLYYMDGPYFRPMDTRGVEILAHYAVNTEAAIITFPYGRGRVLLIGPHPEMGYNPQTGQFTVDGSHGAQWPWLKEMLGMALCQ